MTDRDAVAEKLELLNQPGGILSSGSARSTWDMYGDRADRLRVWDRVISELWLSHPPVVEAGQIEIVTAGPPGAGKSTLVRDVTGFRTIDPDEVKAALLKVEGEARTYDNYLREILPDGRPIALNELAGLVHKESVLVADEMRRRSMARGENVVIQGTLSWSPIVERYVNEIAISGYERVHIVVAAVDVETAYERALSRWWSDRIAPDRPLGGRFVPRAAIETCFDNQGSVCERNATLLRQRIAATLPGVEVTISDEPLAGSGRLRLVDGDAS